MIIISIAATVGKSQQFSPFEGMLAWFPDDKSNFALGKDVIQLVRLHINYSLYVPLSSLHLNN